MNLRLPLYLITPVCFIYLFLSIYSIISIQPNPSFADPKPPRLPIRIEAHRGAGNLEAENTLQAFQKAIDLGLDGIETDVWLTKDKVPILVHGTLEPQKGFVLLKEGRENISLIESKNLKNYTLKNGEKILTLAEGLEFCKDKISLNIEFKDWREEVVDRVLDVIEEKEMLGQVSFSSFYHGLRKRLTSETERRKITAISFGYLSTTFFPKFPDYKTTVVGDTINMDIRYLERFSKAALKQIDKAKENGVLVTIWFPVGFENETKYYEKLMEIGVHTIITNEPVLALEYFEENEQTIQA